MVDEILTGEKTARYSSFRDYILVVFRHKWKAVFFCLIVWTVTFVLTASIEDIYRSEAKILVRLGWEAANVDPTATTADTAGRVSQPQTVQLNTALDIIKSQITAEKVVDKIGPEAFLGPIDGAAAALAAGGAEEATLGDTVVDSMTDFARDVGDFGEELLGKKHAPTPHSLRDSAVQTVMQSMDADLLPNANIVVLSFLGPKPELCQAVVEELAVIYLDQHKFVYRIPESFQFLQKREEEAWKKVEALEDELNKLKAANDVVSIETRQEYVVQNISRLEQEVGAAEAEKYAAEARIESLRGKLEHLEGMIKVETVTPDYTRIEGLQTQLIDLRRLEQEALATYTEGSLRVQGIRQQIASVQEQLDKEEPAERRGWTWQVNAPYAALESSFQMEEANVMAVDARLKELHKQLDAALQERRNLIAVEPRMTSLFMEIEKEKANYDRILAKLDQASLERDLEDARISTVSLLQPATYPLRPEKSRKVQLLIAGLIAGFVGAVGLTFLFASMDHTLQTPEEVEKKLNVPALVSIPRVRSNRVSIKSRLRGSANVSA